MRRTNEQRSTETKAKLLTARSRKKLLRAVYESNKRGSTLLAGLEDKDWLLRGGRARAKGDPYGSRTDLFSRLGRDRARARLDDALKKASTNRLQAYDDEAEILAAIAGSLSKRGEKDLAAVLTKRRSAVFRLKALDKKLISGNGVIDTSDGAGLAESLNRVATPGR